MQHGSRDAAYSHALRPCLAELLRTCVHPPSLVLRVERVYQQQLRKLSSEQTFDTETDPTSYCTKFFLTDGQLTVQALLHRKLTTLIRSERIRRGDLLEIHSFQVKKAPKLNANGQTIYLGIEDCHIIFESEKQQASHIVESRHSIGVQDGTRKRFRDPESPHLYEHENVSGGLHERIKAQSPKRQRLRAPTEPLQLSISPHIEEDCGGTKHTGLALHDESNRDKLETSQAQIQEPLQEKNAIHNYTVQRPSKMPPHKIRTMSLPDGSDSEDEGCFESVRIDHASAAKRREALRELQQMHGASPVIQSPRQSATPKFKQIQTVPTVSASENSKIVRFGHSTSLVRSRTEEACQNGSGIAEGQQIDANPTFITGSEHVRNGQKAYHINETAEAGLKSDSNAVMATHQSQPSTSTPRATSPFHTLNSLIHPAVPLPRKNYVLSTLAVITSVSPSLLHSRPNSPFPPKRHIKIEDPSLYHHLSLDNHDALELKRTKVKAITVAVYRDAINFKPSIGTVALLQGVVMQRFRNVWVGEINSSSGNGSGDDGVILNVYPDWNRKQQTQQGREAMLFAQDDKHSIDGGESRSGANEAKKDEWFIDDLDRLREMGYGRQVDEMFRWWEWRQKR